MILQGMQQYAANGVCSKCCFAGAAVLAKVCLIKISLQQAQ
jgi:hypothetical protein